MEKKEDKPKKAGKQKAAAAPAKKEQKPVASIPLEELKKYQSFGVIGTIRLEPDKTPGRAPESLLSVGIHAAKDPDPGITVTGTIRLEESGIRQFCAMVAGMISSILPDEAESCPALLSRLSVTLDDQRTILSCKTSEAAGIAGALMAESANPDLKSVKAAEALNRDESGRCQWDEIALKVTDPELFPFLMAELKKKQYQGHIDRESLKQLPATNKKYRSLWQQAHRQASAALRRAKGIQAPIQKAGAAGAITKSIENLTFPSSEELRTMFSIARFERLPGLSGEGPANTFDSLGRLYPMSDAVDKLEKINTLKNGMLAYLFSVINETQNEPGDNTFKIYVPRAARDIGLDPRQRLPLQSANKENKFYAPEVQSEAGSESYNELIKNAFLELTADMESMVGVLPNGDMYRALSFQKYDAENKTLTYSSPLLFKMHDLSYPGDSRTSRAVNRLMHSNAANDPPAALELTHAILSGLLERGTSKEKGRKETEYKIKYSTLIFQNCPQLAHDLAEIDRRGHLDPDNEEYIQYPLQYKNAILKRVFNKASEIIFKKSDAFSYWVNLKFNPTDKKTGYILAPTQSTLDRNLVITHEGRPKKNNQ